jgi:exonuclease III
MRQERVDVLGLQETIRQDFSAAELRSLEFGGQFGWNWLPANGHSGGMLLGFRDEAFEVGTWRKGEFFISADILQRNVNRKWSFILVYGPADHSRTEDFLGELEREVTATPLPVVVGGDFNLIRRLQDKSNEVVNWPRIRRFNDAIAAMTLRELNRAGARFTWTNNQLDPIRSVLDRVFVSPSWEAMFPMCTLSAITRIGSDHNPLLLDDGSMGIKRQARFFFQTWWFGVAGFENMLKPKMLGLMFGGGSSTMQH